MTKEGASQILKVLDAKKSLNLLMFFENSFYYITTMFAILRKIQNIGKSLRLKFYLKFWKKILHIVGNFNPFNNRMLSNCSQVSAVLNTILRSILGTSLRHSH